MPRSGGGRRPTPGDRILEVAKNHAITHGWRAARVHQIAADAGVSRPTLYKDFPNKHALGVALFQHELGNFLAELADVMTTHGTGVRAALRIGVLHTLTEADEGPFLAAVLTEDRSSEGALLPGVTIGGPDSLVPLASTAVLEILRRVAPADADPDRLAFAATCAVRLTFSHLLDPTGDPREVTADRIAELCAAYAEGHSASGADPGQDLVVEQSVGGQGIAAKGPVGPGE